MEKFFLERPSIKRKNEIIEYINEFVEYKSNINGTGALDKILEGYTFEQALDRCLNMEDREYAEKVGRCPGKTFLLIRVSDNKIVGTINIRWNLNDKMLRFGGHIGYGIRPTERRKGYNKINLYLGLKVCDKHGIEKVFMDADLDNPASWKTMEAFGGVRIREYFDDVFEKAMVVDYTIDVKKALNDHKEYEEKVITME